MRRVEVPGASMQAQDVTGAGCGSSGSASSHQLCWAYSRACEGGEGNQGPASAHLEQHSLAVSQVHVCQVPKPAQHAIVRGLLVVPVLYRRAVPGLVAARGVLGCLP